MWYIIGFAGAALIVLIGIWFLWWQFRVNVFSLLLAPNLYGFIARHIVVVGLLILFFTLVKSYTASVAEDKAGDWLTSYQGKVTTDIVGRVDPDIAPTSPTPQVSPTASATPTPIPTATATPTPTPTPTPGQKLPQVGSSGGQQTPPPATPTPPPTATEQARMDAQLREIRDRIKHHADVMAFFYVAYFVSIVMVMVAGLLTVVTVFFIAQTGWTLTKSYVKAVFVVASMWTAFYGLFPPVFQQEKNISDNKALFLQYKTLESEVESYQATYLTIKDEPKLPREFIIHVDTEMARLGNIALGFDVSKINYQDALSLSKEKPDANTNKAGAAPQGTPKKQ